MPGRAGFKPLRITYLNTLLFPPIMLLRQLQNALAPTRAVSDVRATAEPLNTLLLSVLRAEKQMLRFTNLPFGVSLFAVARKPAATTPGRAGKPGRHRLAAYWETHGLITDSGGLVSQVSSMRGSALPGEQLWRKSVFWDRQDRSSVLD